MPPNPLRLLICAPDLLARVGLAALFQGYPEIAVVGQVAPSIELAKQVDLYQAEVILWDVGWATAETAELLAAVADSCPPILVLLAATDKGTALWSAGAKGILLRDSDPAAVVAALGTLLHGFAVLDPAILPERGFYPSAEMELPVETLTAREMDVLQALAQGLPNKSIARRLAISEHTVKFHINAILGKLGAQSRTDAVVRATRAGLIQL
ncbi:MAG: response regulator transcription factor [Caldilineaceae bacterium]|nr:response regulator transcription factor [Caldilineaceae bacterium]